MLNATAVNTKAVNAPGEATTGTVTLTPVNPSVTNLLDTSARLNWERG